MNPSNHRLGRRAGCVGQEFEQCALVGGTPIKPVHAGEHYLAAQQAVTLVNCFLHACCTEKRSPQKNTYFYGLLVSAALFDKGKRARVQMTLTAVAVLSVLEPALLSECEA